jgi:peptidoglycan-N-acetylglucosamine deacetylase
LGSDDNYAERSPLSPRQLVRGLMAMLLPKRFFISRGPRGSAAVCLTFDDGPHPVHTPRILDILRDERVHATFFILGRNAKEHPNLVRRMVEEGHGLGYHSFTHANPMTTPVSQVIDENRQTDDALREITPTRVRLTRPPFGKLTAAQLWAMWREKLTVVMWSRDPKDFAADSTEDLRGRLLNQPVRSGDIILLHDTAGPTAELLKDYIAKIRAAGLQFAKVDQWTGHG